MRKSLNRIKITAFIFSLFQLLSVMTLFIFYHLDLFNTKKYVTPIVLFIIVITFIALDIVILFFTIFKITQIKNQQDLKTKDLFGENVQGSLDFSKLGIAVVDDLDNVIWSNNLMENILPSLVDQNIFDVFPKLREFKTRELSNIKVTINEKVYEVKRIEDANIYLFKDVNDFVTLEKYSRNQAIVLGLIMIDNYYEYNTDDSESSDTLANIRTTLVEYFKSYEVLLKKYKSDSYLAICTYSSLLKMQDNNFEVLDLIREIGLKEDVNITLSIGFAHDFPSVYKLNEMANNALKISISRGGDQAVVSKYGTDLQFYGGRSQAIEKKNKVKVRVLADSLISIIKSSSNILIMGHKESDLDSLGSCFGIKAICDACKKESKIIYDSKLIEKTARNAFISTFSKEEADKLVITSKEALNRIDSRTILVCVDFHKPSLALSPALLEACDKAVVIDHHRRNEEFIESPIFTYIESSASSASELITEIIHYASVNPRIDIPEDYATLMLAGIFVDTNYYRSTSSGARTFEASMILKRAGANNIAADDFIKDDFEERILVSKIVSTLVTPYKGIVYCRADEDINVDQVLLSKCANECLRMKGIDAAFVIGRVSNNEVKISARSDGSVNVQLLCEKFGSGGGHFSIAAAIFKDLTIEQVEHRLIDVLKVFLDEAKVDGNYHNKEE